MSKRVAIIGAGPSGLCAIKQCLEEGLVPVCFEASPGIGGLWQSSTEDSNSSVYQSTVVNTSKQMMSYSDFPIPDDWPNFLPHTMVHDYLEMYAHNFKLGPYIKFNRRVQSVKPVIKDGVETGSWEIIYKKRERRGRPGRPTSPDSRPMSPEARMVSPTRNGESSNSIDTLGIQFPLRKSEDSGYSDDSIELKKKSNLKKDVFDFVLICTGHHWSPKMPEFEGMKDFKGPMIHSSAYKVPYPFKDERVLIVGVGNSGIDISSELASHASSVLLSSRSGTWIAPRVTLFGLPTDQLSTRAANSLPRPLLNFALESLMTLHHGDLEKYKLKPKHGFLEQTPVVGSQVLEHIETGKIAVRPNVKKFTANTVEFADGTKDEIDAVILCTGYLIENPFLDPSIMGQQDSSSNIVKLYKHIFPTNAKNLAFIGMVQPIGSILPVAEMQARWATRVFSGKCQLPPLKQMRDETDMDWIEHLKTFVPRERMTIAVNTVPYMDMIAQKIGVLPDLWKLWKTNWSLAANVTFGPTISSHYRLTGPGSCPEVAEKIISNACVGLDLRKHIKK
ncbi:hypothetical protein HK103_002079 [Boothiomyces macroporosus]|uniref:Uncharacterized protein n=1 Tax=Boothiomyces macroporosus TaxID=261099 RepID=A0AAD5U9U6_9FUNG|nr:hypothetical protein HK103_002079 [Boothiomyces macroporosus]